MSLSEWTSSEWSQWPRHQRGHFFNSLYGARIVPLLVTEGPVWNAAPMSQILHVGADPARVGILLRPETSGHQTRKNLAQKPWASLHAMPADHVDQVHQASAAYDEDTSELDHLGWAYEGWPGWPVAYLPEAGWSLALEVHEIHELSNGTALYVFDIHAVRAVHDPLPSGHWVDSASLLHSIGLDQYGQAHLLGGPRPYAKP